VREVGEWGVASSDYFLSLFAVRNFHGVAGCADAAWADATSRVAASAIAAPINLAKQS